MNQNIPQNIPQNISEKAPLDNIRNIFGKISELPDNEDFLSKLKILKKGSKTTTLALKKYSEKTKFKLHKQLFLTVSKKLDNCSVFGAFREVVEGQNHKIGQALCKSKICPICQKVLSWKRRNKAATFFEENKEVLKDYNFYHLVLTLKHNKKLRNENYIDEIIHKFRNLRGTDSKKGDLQKWKIFVEGGYYSVETKIGKDSPHIHIHAILLTNKNVKVQDLNFIKVNWKYLTKDSDQVLIEPIFFLQDEYEEGAIEFTKKDGSKSFKIEYDSMKHDVVYLQRAFMESLKYTIKTDELFSNNDFSDDKMNLVHSLLSKNQNLYNRFGCLINTKKNREIFKGLEKLAINFKDLDNVDKTDFSLIDVETGEQKELKDTKIIVTKFSNTQIKERTENYTLYKFIDEEQLHYFGGEQMKQVSIVLSKTIKLE